MSLTKKMFIDSDFISSFLWVGEQNLIKLVYPDYDIYIPKQVHDEITKPYKALQIIQTNLSTMISDGSANIADDFEIDTPEGSLYLKLTTSGDKFHSIGPGEAAAIVLAKFSNGILASNNLRDVSFYVKKYNVEHITTEKLLLKAYDEGMINEAQGNSIWQKMIAAKLLLPFQTFTESIANYCS